MTGSASCATPSEAQAAAELPLLAAGDDPIKPSRVYGELRKRLARDAVVICDGGDFASYAGKYVEVHQPGGWLDTGPYGCLGNGLGYAIAARVVRPDSQIVVMLGDGAAGFSLMDVDTLVRHNLPVVMVVGNNGMWGLEKHPMQFIYGWDVACDLQPETRYDEVVRSLGGAGEIVRRPDEIGPALDRAFASGVPYLVNVMTDPSDVYPRTSNLGLTATSDMTSDAEVDAVAGPAGDGHDGAVAEVDIVNRCAQHADVDELSSASARCRFRSGRGTPRGRPGASSRPTWQVAAWSVGRSSRSMQPDPGTGCQGAVFDDPQVDRLVEVTGEVVERLGILALLGDVVLGGDEQRRQLAGAFRAADLGDLLGRELGQHLLGRERRLGRRHDLAEIGRRCRHRGGSARGGRRRRAGAAAVRGDRHDLPVDDVVQLRWLAQILRGDQRRLVGRGLAFELGVGLDRLVATSCASPLQASADACSMAVMPVRSSFSIGLPPHAASSATSGHVAAASGADQPALQHLLMNLFTSTTTRVTFPAATRPPESEAVTVNVIRRPSILSR